MAMNVNPPLLEYVARSLCSRPALLDKMMGYIYRINASAYWIIANSMSVLQKIKFILHEIPERAMPHGTGFSLEAPGFPLPIRRFQARDQ